MWAAGYHRTRSYRGPECRERLLISGNAPTQSTFGKTKRPAFLWAFKLKAYHLQLSLIHSAHAAAMATRNSGIFLLFRNFADHFRVADYPELALLRFAFQRLANCEQEDGTLAFRVR
jgi:hypothetical protein